jgi:rhodanese-related sulfurtransferase
VSEATLHGVRVGSLPHVVSDAELLGILRAGAYTIVDARPRVMYDKRHHPGALNISALDIHPMSADTAVQKAIDEKRLQTSDKNAIFLCHCDSGHFAASSRAALERCGYTRALNAKSFAHVGRMLVRAAQGEPEATATYSDSRSSGAATSDATAAPEAEDMSRDEAKSSSNSSGTNNHVAANE